MSKSQNIYDNQTFFEGYHELRKRHDNHNVLIEQPAIARLLPNLHGKRVLDLGCGCGGNCMDFVRRGAHCVVGVDISEKMLDVARREASDSHIEYRCMDMTDLPRIGEVFDLVYSSLAFHYIEDFDGLLADIYRCLSPGGILLFSQEHPMNTAEGHFNYDSDGKPISYTISDYNVPGKRTVTWFVEGVEKYHRPMGQIVSALAHSGFQIEDMIEPVASEQSLEIRPALAKERIKPCFLIIRARK